MTKLWRTLEGRDCLDLSIYEGRYCLEVRGVWIPCADRAVRYVCKVRNTPSLIRSSEIPVSQEFCDLINAGLKPQQDIKASVVMTGDGPEVRALFGSTYASGMANLSIYNMACGRLGSPAHVESDQDWQVSHHLHRRHTVNGIRYGSGVVITCNEIGAGPVTAKLYVSRGDRAIYLPEARGWPGSLHYRATRVPPAMRTSAWMDSIVEAFPATNPERELAIMCWINSDRHGWITSGPQQDAARVLAAGKLSGLPHPLLKATLHNWSMGDRDTSAGAILAAMGELQMPLPDGVKMREAAGRLLAKEAFGPKADTWIPEWSGHIPHKLIKEIID